MGRAGGKVDRCVSGGSATKYIAGEIWYVAVGQTRWRRGDMKQMGLV